MDSTVILTDTQPTCMSDCANKWNYKTPWIRANIYINIHSYQEYSSVYSYHMLFLFNIIYFNTQFFLISQ